MVQLALKNKMQRVKLKELNPPKYNPNEMSESKRKLLKQSLEHYGYIENIVVNKDLTIIDGHHRVDELLNSGIEEEDVVVLDLSKDEEKALNLALRRIKGEADPKLELELVEELSLEGFDLELAGFDELELKTLDEIKQEKQEVKEDNFNPESVEESICKKGDIWQLGRHRLMCGDSTKEEDVKALMDGTKTDMVFTDPPYDFKNQEYFDRILEINNSNCAIFIMLGERELAKLITNYDDYFSRMFGVDTRKAKLVSNKGPMYRMDYVGEFRIGKTKFNNLSDAFSTYIICSKDMQRSQYHSHQKNIELPSIFITHYSKLNENILDLFGGSGSTLMACQQLDRNCYMMELDPQYCDIIIKRFEDFTGEKAIKKN